MYSLVIVDDESNIRKGLAQHYPWDELGFEVVGGFPNGKVALGYLREHPVDVILSDVRMPVMNGIELARSIREEKLHTTIIFLSGYAEFEYAQQALNYHVRNYILKPAKHDEIVKVFQTVKQELDAGGVDDSGGERETGEAHTESGSGYYDKIIEGVEEYVDQNIKNATLKGAAHHVSISPNYLSKVFKQHTGKNFSDFLLEKKMEKSKEMMADINLKIYHISSAIGYNNPKNFSRAFKQYHGVSPREYR